MLKKALFITIVTPWMIFISCKTDNPNKFIDEVLDIAIPSDPDRLNPIVHLGSVARLIHQYIYLPCADYHPETEELYPILLESIPEPNIIPGTNSNKVQYTLVFKKDATWDDGTPISGEDYLFTIKLIMHPAANTNAYKSFLADIESVNVDDQDPKEVNVLFGREYMLSLESAATIPVLPKHIYDPKGVMDQYSFDQMKDKDFIESVSATDTLMASLINDLNGLKYSRDEVNNNGPYRLESWTTDQNLVLIAKENYWGNNYPENPFLQQGPQKMIFYIIPDNATVVAQLKDGSIDVANYLTSKQFVDLRDNETFKDSFDFFNPVMRRYYFLGLNNSHPLLSDVRVREALAHILDVEEIIKNIDFGMGKRVSSLVHPDRTYYNPAIKAPNYDPDKAKEILETAGWTDSDNDGDLDKNIQGQNTDLELEMYVSQAELGRQVALMLQGNASQIGVKINITTKNSYIRDNVMTRDYAIAPLVFNQDLNDDDFYNRWHSDSDAPNRRNYFSYRDQEADQIIENIRISTNAAERKELYLQLQEIVEEDHPVIFLYSPMEKIVVNKNWKGSATVKRPGYLANTFTPNL